MPGMPSHEWPLTSGPLPSSGVSPTLTLPSGHETLQSKMLPFLSTALRPSPVFQAFCHLPFPALPQRFYSLTQCLTFSLKYQVISFHHILPLPFYSAGDIIQAKAMSQRAPQTNLPDIFACAREL